MTFRSVVLVAACAVGCGGAATPASPAPTSSSTVVVPIEKPPPRARDDESDAFGPGGQRGSAATKPPVECPPGARFTGSACVYTEVSCPAGSRRVQNTCVGDVTCPNGAVWDGDVCRPSATVAGTATAPTTVAAPPPGGCFFNVNSIPASQVLLDGVALGWTPRIHAPATVGSHTFVFIGDHAKKSVTASCAAGETKTVAIKFAMDDPGY